MVVLVYGNILSIWNVWCPLGYYLSASWKHFPYLRTLVQGIVNVIWTYSEFNEWLDYQCAYIAHICMCMYLYFRELWVCELHCGDSKLVREKAGISRCLQWADIRTRTTTSSTATHRMSLKDKHTCTVTIWICDDLQQSTMRSCCLLYYYSDQNDSSIPSTMIYTDKYSNEVCYRMICEECI